MEASTETACRDVAPDSQVSHTLATLASQITKLATLRTPITGNHVWTPTKCACLDAQLAFKLQSLLLHARAV